MPGDLGPDAQSRIYRRRKNREPETMTATVSLPQTACLTTWLFPAPHTMEETLYTFPIGFLALACDYVAIMKPAQTLEPNR